MSRTCKLRESRGVVHAIISRAVVHAILHVSREVVHAIIHVVRGVVHTIIHVSRRVVHAILSYNKFKAFYCQYVKPIWSLSATYTKCIIGPYTRYA